jgi:hypothetical protein
VPNRTEASLLPGNGVTFLLCGRKVCRRPQVPELRPRAGATAEEVPVTTTGVDRPPAGRRDLLLDNELRDVVHERGGIADQR